MAHAISTRQQHLMGMAHAVASGKKKLADMPKYAHADIKRIIATSEGSLDKLREFASTNKNKIREMRKAKGKPIQEGFFLTYNEYLNLNETAAEAETADNMAKKLREKAERLRKEGKSSDAAKLEDKANKLEDKARSLRGEDLKHNTSDSSKKSSSSSSSYSGYSGYRGSSGSSGSSGSRGYNRSYSDNWNKNNNSHWSDSSGSSSKFNDVKAGAADTHKKRGVLLLALLSVSAMFGVGAVHLGRILMKKYAIYKLAKGESDPIKRAEYKRRLSKLLLIELNVRRELVKDGSLSNADLAKLDAKMKATSDKLSNRSASKLATVSEGNKSAEYKTGRNIYLKGFAAHHANNALSIGLVGAGATLAAKNAANLYKAKEEIIRMEREMGADTEKLNTLRYRLKQIRDPKELRNIYKYTVYKYAKH